MVKVHEHSKIKTVLLKFKLNEGLLRLLRIMHFVTIRIVSVTALILQSTNQ